MQKGEERDGMDVKDEKYKKIAKEVNETICENLEKLLEARNLSQREFCQKMAENQTSVTRSYFNRLLKERQNIPAAFLLSCCDFFGITLQNLASPDFDAAEYIYNETKEHEDYLRIEALLRKADTRKEQTASAVSQNAGKGRPPRSGNFLTPFTDTELITDPSHSQFAGYLQRYYCYYYPTHSSENREEKENILKGVLELSAEKGYCRAFLKINTNTVNEHGDINYKKYDGYAAISTTVNSLSCIMYSTELCEFCFLMFRHFKLNFGKQDCRIAEVLSSSSAAEDRRPTVLRMLLSREEINDTDLKAVEPSFLLNYSTIAISGDNLQKIGDQSDAGRKIADAWMAEHDPEPMYFCKEDDMVSLASRYLDKKETLEFIMNLRACSYAYRYNKVSMKADDAVRQILLARGYYKKN